MFLHPLAYKYLEMEKTLENLPRTLSSEIKRKTMVPSQNRKKYKFLQHLSLSEDIYFVEINMRPYLSQDCYDLYLKDIQRFYSKKKDHSENKLQVNDFSFPALFEESTEASKKDSVQNTPNL